MTDILCYEAYCLQYSNPFSKLRYTTTPAHTFVVTKLFLVSREADIKFLQRPPVNEAPSSVRPLNESSTGFICHGANGVGIEDKEERQETSAHINCCLFVKDK